MARVLLVEDDAAQRELCVVELGHAGYQVFCAGDGAEANHMVALWSPDIVVMDINMPGVDGIETMNRLLARNNKLPIVIHTAYASYKEDFRTWAADGYVVKSLDLTELKNTISRVLASRGQEQLANS